MIKSALLSPAPFGRMLTAMVTPFDEDGKVDYGLAADLANYLVDQGSDGIVVCGTTGESPTLTWQEQQKMLETVRNSLGSRAKVLAGTGSNSTSEAIEATKEAANSGADGALVVGAGISGPVQVVAGEGSSAATGGTCVGVFTYTIADDGSESN